MHGRRRDGEEPDDVRLCRWLRDPLIVPDKAIEAVYFVESGRIFRVATLEDGTQAESRPYWPRGMVDPRVGINIGFEETFVQAKGMALQMEADAFGCSADPGGISGPPGAT
jgi:hypothetical protein